GSGPRTVSQAAIASLAPFVAYMIRALFCQGETGLVRGVRELAVRRPAVADHDAAVAGAEDRGGLGVAAAGLDGVDGHVARDEDPEPPPPPADFPPGLVGGDDRAPPHGHDQRVGGRRTARRHAVQRLHEAARCDRQPAAGAQDRGDLQSNAKTPGKKTAWRTTRNMIIDWSAAPAADIGRRRAREMAVTCPTKTSARSSKTCAQRCMRLSPVAKLTADIGRRTARSAQYANWLARFVCRTVQKR